MGYRDFTQKFQEEKKQPNAKEKIVIKNQLLQDLYQIVTTSVISIKIFSKYM